ncbi:MAG: hypothetical protein ACOYL5_02030 [Phototrophicaceae bacterium]
MSPLETVTFQITYYTGREEGDIGYPYYVAACDVLHAVTDAKTLDALLENIREVTELALADEDTIAVYGVIVNPAIRIQPA